MWILMEVTESTQRHTRVRLKQIELVLFTLCDGSYVFRDVAAEISAKVMVRRQITRSICRIGPVVGTGLPVGSTLVASPTYEPQHYKTNKMTCASSEDSDQPGHPPSQWVAEDPVFLHSDSEDSDQTGRMSRLIWVFAGRRGHFVVLVVRRFIKSEPYSKKVLNAASLQCTRGKSSVAKKTEVDPKLFKW